MPTSNTSRVSRRAGVLTAAALLSTVGLGPLPAQAQNPLARSFDELFAGESRAIPTFTRPEIIARLPPLPIAPEESSPAVAVSAGPSESAPAASASVAHSGNAPPQDRPEHSDGTTVARAFKNLIAPPAEAEPSPASPSGELAQAYAAQDITGSLAPPDQRATQETPVSRPTRASRLGERLLTPLPRNTGVSRAGPLIARQMLRVGRQESFDRLGGGRAVWYQHPGRTASGEVFNPNALTAAHPTLPLGTRVRVVNRRNGRSVVVRINDRAPKASAAIDLSRGSARALGIESVGSVALYKVR